MDALSFNIDNKEEFKFLRKNVFEQDNCVHYLFTQGKFVFWVSATDGVVDGVTESMMEQLEEWNDNSLEGREDLKPEDGDYFVTEEEYGVHVLDAKILMEQYKDKLQEKIKFL